jgi:hypothetical protein
MHQPQPQREPHPAPPPDYAEGEKIGVPEAPPVLDSAEARDALDCPLCKYSLRGLADVSDPRCPECGYRFTWRELLNARQNLHPYLFEHHQPGYVRSFFLTLWRGMRPAKFWSGLNAAHEVRPRALVAYCLLMTLLVALSLWVGWYLAHAGALYAANWNSWVNRFQSPMPPQPAFFRQALRYGDTDGIEAHLLFTVFAWPWLTLGALLVFRSSMNRAFVDVTHVFRCVVYSFDAFLWMFAFGVLAGLAAALGPIPERMQFARAVERYLVLGLFLALIIATYRLGQAYRRYLRFEHAWGTVILSQVLVVLTAFTFLAAFDSKIAQLFW